MNNELIRRYIYAVASCMPQKTQTEVERDLENMISELLEARCGGAEPAEGDVRAVLGQLGAPGELAVNYSGDESRAFIGGIYLMWFRKALKIVLPIAAAGVALASLASALLEGRATQEVAAFAAETAARCMFGAAEGAGWGFVWVTLIFRVLERKRVRLNGEDFLSKLPPVPDRRARMKPHEPIVQMLWCMLVAAIFLGFPQIISGYSEATGWLPALNVGYIRAHWYLMVLFAAFGLARELFRLVRRRYDLCVLLVSGAANVLGGIAASLLFGSGRIMNPAFIESLGPMFGGEAFVYQVFGHVNLWLLALVWFALLVDTGLAAYRALRRTREG
ncbi:MAG: hypothetical protein LBG83_07710 [Oscillospiraceae bacterium]|jgi:hypothetical protein|nr:hypothetical protein [Oscillospiraceae bacterium]